MIRPPNRAHPIERFTIGGYVLIHSGESTYIEKRGWVHLVRVEIPGGGTNALMGKELGTYGTIIGVERGGFRPVRAGANLGILVRTPAVVTTPARPLN